MDNLNKLINIEKVDDAGRDWLKNTPFPHLVVDGFFKDEIADALEKEFPNFDDGLWHQYQNALEVKKTSNNWNKFPELTYQVFSTLNSRSCVDKISSALLSGATLCADPGLNGGGWHIHKSGGKLNTHLDYSIHPKLGLQRKINLIVYLNSNWHPSWGGHLGFWGNESAEAPGNLEKQIEPLFNRAVIFDTTFNSWHGLPTPLQCPDNEFRKSIAVYYLTEASPTTDKRGKALFAPTSEQASDQEVLDLIKDRSNTSKAHKVYE